MSDWNKTIQVYFNEAATLEALEAIPKLGPQPGEVFEALPLEALREHFTEAQHIHRCAMINLETPADELQGRVMDYILANEHNVPLFMLNIVPWYLDGYKKAMVDNV